MLCLLAAVLELFVDFAPEGASFERFFRNGKELREEFLAKGWEVRSFEQGEESTWVFWNLGNKVEGVNLAERPKEKMVLFTWEPPTVMPEIHDPKVQAHFGKIFTWDDDLVDNVKYFKFYYPVLSPQIPNIPPFEKKKFCTMIATKLKSDHPKQLYSERKRVALFFEGKKGEFDLYGRNWSKKSFKNYRGPIGNKIDVLKNYKFAICYENMRDVKGYITEKIFDCFAAGVVPVYWGASNVTDYIPADCFVDRRWFANNEELYRFLKKMTKSEYRKYVRNGALFLQSDQAKLFSKEELAKTFLSVID